MSGTSAGRVVELAASSLGLNFRDEWRGEASSAVESMARARRMSVADLEATLPTDNELLTEIARYLTVGETFFFRYPSHFELIAAFAQRRWLADNSHKLTIWSAGCSTGEEAYSVAMAIAEAGGAHRLAAAQIFATDTSSLAIEKARRGEYSAWSFRGVSDARAQPFFADSGAPGQRMIRADIRRAVSFNSAPIDLYARQFTAQSQDIVLFRNVAIYLNPEYLSAVFTEFRRILRPDGLLIVAPSDPRPAANLFDRVEDESTSIYTPHRELPGKLGHPVGKVPRVRVASEPNPYVRARAPLGVVEAEGTELPSGAGLPSKAAMPPLGLPQPAPATPIGPRSSTVAHVPSPAAGAPTRAPKPALRVVAPEAPTVSLTAIEALADTGKILEALRALEAMPADAVAAPDAMALRGRLYLAAGEPELAIAQLRTVLYLQPDAHMPRFWYILALRKYGRADQARSQAVELLQRLESVDSQSALGGARAKIADLKRAVREMLESGR